MTTVNRILRVLAEGPSTSGEIAAAIGIDRRTISAQCHDLFKAGRVTRTSFRASSRAGRRSVYLYAPRGRLGAPK